MTKNMNPRYIDIQSVGTVKELNERNKQIKIETAEDVAIMFANPENKPFLQKRPHDIRERLAQITRHHTLEALPGAVGEAKAALLIAEHAQLSTELAALHEFGLT
ncbi:hypothetical protein GO003_002795 [Methylicorpusculum oleiharenae]|uniref:hypothetical protein n=1 Tax=Methylicorpusculum oleiharenae TaxID=1338687 RepID=UPI001356D871|nr:hypothetical protein [Methylicorpusculum oleiharenae]MCD2449316.1 hypothetical protein [Methylicorpusculum oleiharenae]